jgi:hypothetical protein
MFDKEGDMRTMADVRREHAYYSRVGRLMQDPIAQNMYMSEGLQIGKSWRTTMGFYIARALGWPRAYRSEP